MESGTGARNTPQENIAGYHSYKRIRAKSINHLDLFEIGTEFYESSKKVSELDRAFISLENLAAALYPGSERIFKIFV